MLTSTAGRTSGRWDKEHRPSRTHAPRRGPGGPSGTLVQKLPGEGEGEAGLGKHWSSSRSPWPPVTTRQPDKTHILTQMQKVLEAPSDSQGHMRHKPCLHPSSSSRLLQNHLHPCPWGGRQGGAHNLAPGNEHSGCLDQGCQGSSMPSITTLRPV